MIPAARILETTSQFIPTGQAQDVKDSPFDFSTSRSIGAHLYNDNEQLHWNKGYNHCYILKEESSDTLLTVSLLPVKGSDNTAAVNNVSDDSSFRI